MCFLRVLWRRIPEFHGAVRNALVKSIVNSGDGKSPETAMYVIGFAEEYEALQELGLTQESQRLEQKNNRHYDVFAARDSTSEKRDVYFAVDESCVQLSGFTSTAAVFFYFLNKSLCEPVRASVNMSVSPEIL